ncbi:hypothetical protein LZ30DRAFT_770687 [Colletotrichum cereale]|nr:hypothetical protein LZ30DRAFT_770687 [Colletotrichum cereale]
MAEAEKEALEPQERYNALIKPTDDDWVRVHDRFKDLLAQPTLRTEQVLDSYFTAHERKMFMPATEPLSLRSCQEDNTRRYKSLIAGRFKDCHLSLATKFTMLYFGLPVEPILSELVESAKPDFDVDDGDELFDVEVRPPLHFLTAHDQRNYGRDHMRGTEAHFATIPVPASQMPKSATAQGLDLRGGGFGDDDDNDSEMLDGRRSQTAGQGRQPTFGEESDDDYEEDDLNAPLVIPGSVDPTKPTRISGSDARYRLASSIQRPLGSRVSFASASRPAASGRATRVRFEEEQVGTSQTHDYVPLYGYQGRIMFKPGDTSTFETASRKLLSLRRREGCDLVLVEFDQTSRHVRTSFHDNIPLSPNGNVANRLRQKSKSGIEPVWFVLRRGESQPKEWEPQNALFLSSLFKLSHLDKGHENVSYCNFPSQTPFVGGSKSVDSMRSPLQPWGANQYMPFLTTAQQVLTETPDRPGASHCDIEISAGDGRTSTYSMYWYGGLEMHAGLLNMMNPSIVQGTSFVVRSRPLPEDCIVFYLPGGIIKSAATSGNRQCHRQANSIDPYPDALQKVKAMTEDFDMPQNISYRIWRGTDYFNPSIKNPLGPDKPVSWDPRGGEVQKQHQDQARLSKFIVNAVDNGREPCRFFVIQPSYERNDPRTIETPMKESGSAVFQGDSDTMETFKAKVQGLYRDDPMVQYDPGQDSVLVAPIHKKGDSQQWNPVYFVLRPDAADCDLVIVGRLSVAQTMRVTVLKNDKLDFVKGVAKGLDEENQWGPRYGQVTPLRPELFLPPVAQPVQKQHLPAQRQPGEVSREMPKMPEQNPRETSWGTQPSFYDNGIYHPSFPINAPPVESVMRTGGSRVPMITRNVLTVTEQHKMQDALWKTRGMVLDRISKCPYDGCNFSHRVDEDTKLVRHLEENHAGQKCPWCDVQFFPLWSRKQKEAHYKTVHRDQLRNVLEQTEKPAPRPQTSQTSTAGRLDNFSVPLTPSLSPFKIMERARPASGPLPRPAPPPKASEKEADYRYCDRCGRDHTQLTGQAERIRHDRLCVPLAEGGGLCTFCEACGDVEWKTEQDAKEFAPFDVYPHKCRGTDHRNKPHCTKCGLSMKNMTDEVIDKHHTYCAGYYGTMGCFCPYCQRHFVKDDRQDPIQDIKKHISECKERDVGKATPYEIYPETYWEDQDTPADPLYMGRAASAMLVRRQRRPNGPTRYLSFPLMWYEKSGPVPTQDPPSECKTHGCREPLFGLTPSEVLGHFETNHGGQPQKQCPLCHLSFRRPKDEREAKPELGEWEDRKAQVSHMECHVYQLWDRLALEGPPPPTTTREPFYAGHSLWDPDNERALDRRDKRCPHFDKCGAMVGFMNQKQWNHHMETAHAAEDFELRVPHDKKADIQIVFEERRRQREREGKPPMAGQAGLVTKPKESGHGAATGASGRKPMTGAPAINPQEQSRARGAQARGDVPNTNRPLPVGPEGTRPEGTAPRAGRPEGARSNKETETQATDLPRQVEGPAAKPKNTTEKPRKSTGKTEGSSKTAGRQTSKTRGKPALGQKASQGSKPKTAAPLPSYDAAEDLYCSRCFRKAPKRGSKVPDGDPTRQEQIDAHSDRARSCRIRPQLGRVKFNHDGEPILPSRVGWIRKDNLKFKNIRDAFVRDNPQLEKTMCPTDAQWKRTYSKWTHDPNNENNQDVWGLPYRPRKDQYAEDSEEDDGEEDYVDGEEDEGGEDEDEDMGEDEEESEGEEAVGPEEEQEDQGGEDDSGGGAEGNPDSRRKKKRTLFRGVHTHDPTYRDRGDGDDLSEEDPSELVPESGGAITPSPRSVTSSSKLHTRAAPSTSSSTRRNNILPDPAISLPMPPMKAPRRLFSELLRLSIRRPVPLTPPRPGCRLSDASACPRHPRPTPASPASHSSSFSTRSTSGRNEGQEQRGHHPSTRPGAEREPPRRKGPATVRTLLASGGLLSLFVGLSEPFQLLHEDDVADASVPAAVADGRDPSLPRFTLSEVRKHDAKSKSPWVTQGDKVYDITEWVGAHPGGDVILRAAGGSIDPYWDIFTIHKSPHVYEILNQYLIGLIDSNDLVDGKPATQEIEDPFKHDPVRDPRLITLTPKPRNAETPLEGLADSYLTPNELFYVRNHMWVPQVDDTSDYTLKIELLDGSVKEYTIDDLKTKFKPATVVAVLQCSGNRRSDMTRNARKTNGLQWNVGAISCAEWQGVKLSDVLADAGLPVQQAMTGDSEAKHVQFSALEAYGASIPIESALDPRGDVLLAYSMNGKPLPPDHGYPLRALVPGHVAARSVKWLSQITISDEESHSQWQRKDYKCFGPNETSPDWDRAAPIQEMPITSAITTVRLGDWMTVDKDSASAPKKDEGREASLMGYAYSGGGRRIVRVDVSLDNGRTWDQAELLDEYEATPPKAGHRSWAWKRWRYEGIVPLGEPGDGSKRCSTLLVKATDEAYNSQPESYEAIYNQRGNLANAWHRLRVCSECANQATVAVN